MYAFVTRLQGKIAKMSRKTRERRADFREILYGRFTEICSHVPILRDIAQS